MSALEEIETALLPGEEVDSVVFGLYGWRCGGDEDDPVIPKEHVSVALRWTVAKQYLTNWSIAGGFGSPDCFAIYVWTQSRVGFIAKYDGSTWLQWIPRQPTDCMPEMAGGG